VLQEATDPRVIGTLSRVTNLPHWGARRDHSIGFMSRLPVSHHEWHHPRGSKHAFLEVALADVECRIFGLHLAAWFSSWSERRRAREIRALLQGIAEHQHGPHVIAGDFNALAPGEALEVKPFPAWIRAMIRVSGGDIARETIQAMLDAGYVDAWRTLHEDDSGYTFPTWDPHVRLDYLFTPARDRERLSRCEVLRTPAAAKDASDHFPLVVELAVDPVEAPRLAAR
jgi:exodeoxyribonuclease-3